MLKAADDQISAIRARASAAAGPTESLRHRARSYLELYFTSNRVCMFALVAAHGAIWASWYLVCAKLAAMVLAVLDPTCRLSPLRRYREFSAYVTALKEINRQVMIESYVLVHTIRDLGPDIAIAQGVPADIANDYADAMEGGGLSPDALRDLYHRHFIWEQDRVVSSSLDEAFAVFTWPLMKSLCQRPWVWFSYFRVGASMNFRNFTDKEERVEKGLLAFDRAMAFGADELADVTGRRLKVFPGLRSNGKQP